MKKRRSYNPFPMPTSTRRQRMDDAIASDIARARRNTPPAANDAALAQEQSTEREKKNG